MPKQNTETKKDNIILKFLKNFITGKVFIGIIIILVIVAGAIGLNKLVSSDNKTTKIGFENIGELATQSAYCTEINVIEASRELFGVKIPFTQSKYIYSYDVVVKAGFDFGKIEWNINNTTIEVKLPKAKILSNDIDLDSFKIYHEDESIFTQITLAENNEALAALKQTAEKKAIENGLLDNARNNAETILTSYFANEYDLEKYEITFTDK